MSYETLYDSLQPMEKDLKDVTGLISRLYKKIAKDTETGNLTEIKKNVSQLLEAANTLAESAKIIETEVGNFDNESYFRSGEFTEEMLSACADRGLDVIGESPVFEMFPYRVRVDVDNMEVFLDRKKMQTIRPKTIAETIYTGREKLMKANFNAQKFADELVEAYDVTLLKSQKRPGSDIYLTNIYKTLVPMGRFRRDYDQNSFAFDIARLYDSDVEMTKKGRRWQFGPSRNNSKAIRILDAEGNEQFLATIKFFDAEE